MKIFLIGMPGSGKSTLGKELAEKLSLPFIDLDDVIVEMENRTIPDIFTTEGEDYFRVIERKALHKADGLYNDFVMATGGGAPCFFDNTTYIKNSGISVYLKVSAKELTDRLLNKGQSNRPLLEGIDVENLINEISSRLEERSPYYQQAEIVLESDEIRTLDIETAIDQRIEK